MVRASLTYIWKQVEFGVKNQGRNGDLHFYEFISIDQNIMHHERNFLFYPFHSIASWAQLESQKNGWTEARQSPANFAPCCSERSEQQIGYK